jgi:trans-aconitate methyltransferase
MYASIEAYYSARVAKYGATPLGVDWSCQATQSLRFVQLLKICDFAAPFTLNDIGCGYGALAAFLAMRYPEAKIDYLGLDLSRAMVSRLVDAFQVRIAASSLEQPARESQTIPSQAES